MRYLIQSLLTVALMVSGIVCPHSLEPICCPYASFSRIWDKSNLLVSYPTAQPPTSQPEPSTPQLAPSAQTTSNFYPTTSNIYPTTSNINPHNQQHLPQNKQHQPPQPATSTPDQATSTPQPATSTPQPTTSTLQPATVLLSLNAHNRVDDYSGNLGGVCEVHIYSWWTVKIKKVN